MAAPAVAALTKAAALMMAAPVNLSRHRRSCPRRARACGTWLRSYHPPRQVLEGMTIEGTPIFNKLPVEDQVKF